MTDLACLAGKCTRPQTAGILLCDVCARQLGDWLAKISSEYEQLDAVPSMQGREPDSGGSGGLASQRAVGSLAVMTLRDRRGNERIDADPDRNGLMSVYGTLHRWAELVRARPDVASLPGRTVASERALLAAELDWCMQQPWVWRMHDDVRRLYGQLRAANGTPAARVGYPCPCGGIIRWTAGAATCGTCGETTTGLDVVRKLTPEAVK